MKFSIAVTLLSLASTSWASSGAVTTVDSVAGTIESLLTKYEAAISQAVTQIKGSTSVIAVVQAEALVNANLAAIVLAIEAAEASVQQATVGTAGILQNTITNLVQSDLATLAADVNRIANAIKGLGASLTVVANVGGSVQAVVQGEINAVKAAIQPFVQPIEDYLNAVLKSNVGATLDVTGVQNALNNLQAVVASVRSL